MCREKKREDKDLIEEGNEKGKERNGKKNEIQTVIIGVIDESGHLSGILILPRG